MGEVIEYKVWVNEDGRRASVSGALPAGEGWTVKVEGFTIRHPDGTTGLGRKPFETREEAQGWVDRNPNFSGMQRD